MNPSYFKPVRPDGRAVWQVIFDFIEPRLISGELKIGAILTHATLRGLLEEREQSGYNQAITRTSKELQRRHSRALQSSRKVGYVLIGGASQVEFGQTYRKRGQRNIRNGLNLIRSADRSVMSPGERSWADKVQNGMVALANIAQMHEERLAEHNDAIEALKSSQKSARAATADELAELRRRIDEIARAKDSQGK